MRVTDLGEQAESVLTGAGWQRRRLGDRVQASAQRVGIMEVHAEVRPGPLIGEMADLGVEDPRAEVVGQIEQP